MQTRFIKNRVTRKTTFTLLIAVLFSFGSLWVTASHAEYVEQSYNVESWMADISTYLGNKELRDIIIPGTHDSGSRDVKNELFAPWTETQNHTIYSQLLNGIRYIDVRTTYCSSESTWIFSHAGYDMEDDLFPALEDIHYFLNTHPKEIVIVDFQHFPEWDDSDDQAHLAEFRSELMNTLGAYMVPQAWGVHTLVSTLWQQNRRLIVIMNDTMYDTFNSTDRSSLWKRDTAIRSYWANKQDEEDLIRDLDNEVVRMNNGYNSQTYEYYDKFHVLQAQTTPSSSDIDSIWDMANDTNPAVLPLLYGRDVGLGTTDWSSAPLNIIIMDYAVDTIDLASVCKTENMDTNEGVYLYEHCNYGGYWTRITESTPTLGKRYIVDQNGYDDHTSMNDQISSIYIIGDYQVEIFEDTNYGGASMLVTDSVSCLTEYSYSYKVWCWWQSEDWNDDISSIKVYKNQN